MPTRAAAAGPGPVTGAITATAGAADRGACATCTAGARTCTRRWPRSISRRRRRSSCAPSSARCASGRALRPEAKQTREDLARAISGAVLDRGAIDATFARHDKSIGELRGAFTGALERIHASLDDQQRERLAEMLDRGGRAGGPGGGPYRV
jgi:hypothetical protein